MNTDNTDRTEQLKQFLSPSSAYSVPLRCQGFAFSFPAIFGNFGDFANVEWGRSEVPRARRLLQSS